MSNNAGPDLDLAQALADLAKGEMTASALEAHLTTLEDKMDQILAVFDAKDTLPEELTPVQDQETSNGFPTKNNSHTNQGETTPDLSQ